MTGDPCLQPGCSGTIDGGYCTVCGMAPSAGTASRGTRGTGTGLTRSSSGRSGPSGASGRGSLGAGLIDIPPVPYRDPATAILANPQVPENKRFCGNCDRPVGRSRGDQPGLADGFCPNCGSAFSFTPKLAAGELVAGQYEVLGCLAHGGLGWIYLAMDHNLGKRWVVLKGLLNSGDAAAQEAAVAERRFLAEVEHPSIVGVYNFVQHAGAGYIVMEYVGGRSLRQLLLDRRQAGGPATSMPVPVALAYLIEVLPALGYLHDRGLVYCDFKPDNVIQTQEQLKIIDMGGVRRIDDTESAIYGTVGYQAPEIADEGPTPSSDLYTVGRSLAVLTFEFTGYQSTYQYDLPDPATVPVLAQQDSFYRALRRATDRDPDRRFGSAAEMRDQLTGVLRQVLASDDQQPRAAFSLYFGPELAAIGVPATLAGDNAGVLLPSPAAAEVAAGLPMPLADPADPAASFLASLGGLDPRQLAAELAAVVAGTASAPPEVAESVDTVLALARARILSGDAAGAIDCLAGPAAGDWRAGWYRGLAGLMAGNAPGARGEIDAACDTLPGELAPWLALGFAAEAAGDLAAARRHYELVWITDRSFVSAAFGLARTRLRASDRTGAISALASVPTTSRHHQAAQVAVVRVRLSAPDGAAVVSADDLREAGRGFGGLQLDDLPGQQVAGQILRAALDRVLAGQPLGAGRLLDCEPTERALRFGLERAYRAQARLAPDRVRRTELVDLANAVRPSTWS
jgi:serine/threonine-protein kinase PknG